MSLDIRQRQLIDDYGIIPDPKERLAAIVDRAGRLPRLTHAERTAANLVKGCISPVWLTTALLPDGTVRIRCDAESPLVLGLVALLCEFYNGAAPADIAATEPRFLDELGLIRDLSPTRRNGLAAVRARIREHAQSSLGQPRPESLTVQSDRGKTAR